MSVSFSMESSALKQFGNNILCVSVGPILIGAGLLIAAKNPAIEKRVGLPTLFAVGTVLGIGISSALLLWNQRR